jgi:hypothetical protein
VNEETLRRSYERLLVIREQEGPDRDRCPSVDDLYAMVKRDGDEAGRLRLLDHVMQCPECRKEFDLLRSIEQARPPAPASPWRLWAFAAGVVLVVGATMAWRMMQPAPDVMRGPADQVALVGPADGATVALPATLTWRPVAGALSYRIELLNEAGAVAWSSEVTDTALVLERAPQGVAGWKVTAEFLGAVPLESPARAVRLAQP